ncbi:MAG: ribonuclease III [Lachnospiraceae bacterium]|jgi:ribonuclease-3|nr:ribonuclease III [Lachnospiraceae bacterium]
MEKQLYKLEDIIKYKFKDIALLEKAMTHSSSANERHLPKYENNERLEFLGDAVLEVVTSEFLFFKYPHKQEGELTKMRASLVCERALMYCASTFGLPTFLILGKGEESTGGRQRESLISDACEALIGAIFIDGGFESAKEFILKFILIDVEERQLMFDSKTILQEIVQGKFKEPLEYRLLLEEGPDHNKKFTVAVFIGENEYAIGSGGTKKAAEQRAAYATILQLKSKG